MFLSGSALRKKPNAEEIIIQQILRLSSFIFHFEKLYFHDLEERSKDRSPHEDCARNKMT
jgi:hypothetical protein